MQRNLLGGPEPTLLPEDPATAAVAEPDADVTAVAAAYPASSLAWAILATRALQSEPPEPVAAYAYARTGYHRGLDALRRAGWRGHGPIPWEHVPNQGFLRALDALGRASAAIGDDDEAQRIGAFILDASPEAVEALGRPAA